MPSHRVAALTAAIIASASVFAEPIVVDKAMPLPRKISEFNLFADNQAQAPNEGVVAYDLSTPLFTDYALKDRFIHVPAGTSAAYNETEVFEFPVGTVIAKTFSYPADMRKPTENLRRIETRILWHRENGWVALPYLWDDTATDAKLAVAGARVPVSWVHTDGETRSIDYLVPNMNQCKLCHENQGKLGPIGPKARYLNKNYAYPEGPVNQIDKLVSVGFLGGAPEKAADRPQPVYWDDPHSGTLAERARTYLDINCMHCHNPKGPAFTSGLDLTYFEQAAHRIGIYKPPVAAGRGSAGLKFGIVPEHPEQSILLARMESLDPGVMMPQLGRGMVHQEGIALIAEWIKSLNPDDYTHLMEKGDDGETAP